MKGQALHSNRKKEPRLLLTDPSFWKVMRTEEGKGAGWTTAQPLKNDIVSDSF